MATSYLLSHKNLIKGVQPFKQRLQESNRIQQSDYLKEFMTKIVGDGGLEEAYQTYGDNPPHPGAAGPPAGASTPPEKRDCDVIIVGAGMAGLSAAYELKRAGLSVKILEQTDRYGGRVFTYDLGHGLYGEAGAMRFPGSIDQKEDRPHFLTHHYVEKFGINIKKFPNVDENAWSNIYGLKERTNEWTNAHFDTVWPNWKHPNWNDMKVRDIGDYFDQTIGVVTGLLKRRLEKVDQKKDNPVIEEIAIWKKWIDEWSQFTLESFLESNVDVIKAKLPGLTNSDPDILSVLKNLLPWSNDALRGYCVSSYTQQLDQSLVQYLREKLGVWWSEDMHTLVGGMHSLPAAFFGDRPDCLTDKDIHLNQQVSKICYHFDDDESSDKDYVTVTCYHGEKDVKTYKALAVIVTTPVNRLRQITFTYEPRQEPVDPDDVKEKNLRKVTQAVEDIFTGPSTKIILQTRRRFWEKEPDCIVGGFSKTNLPIGQIHYVQPDDVNQTEKGIILIYTWKNEALLFGSMNADQIKKEVIEQISVIHTHIKDEVEDIRLNGDPDNKVPCIVHAWYNQPSYQGAYGLLKTTQFDNIRYLWEPLGNVHFAGETISFAAGWIQGALESGLKSAYQVYDRYRKSHASPK